MREATAPLDLLRREFESNEISNLQGRDAEVRLPDCPSSSFKQCTVIGNSPLGIRLLLPAAESGGYCVGACVEVKAALSDGLSSIYRGVVASASMHTSQSRELGVRITQRTGPRISHLERRREVRWLCSDEFLPTGIAANPSRSNDFLLFQILDISRRGMRLLTSLRNNFIVRGMRLDVIVSFPMVAQISLRLHVQNVSFVSRNEKEYLSIGAQIETLQPREAGVVGQYMAQFGDVDSLREFKDAGFAQSPLRRSLDFSVVRTERDYREVLNLRYLAYLADGKIPSSSTVNDVSDIHDSRARILICKYRGKAIATARLAFHELGDITEHEEFIAWPSAFPRRDDAVEVTRACTHPDYRGVGLFFALLRHIVTSSVQAGRTWVITSSTEDLVPLYKFVGMKEAGVAFNHPELNNLKHVMLTGSIPDALSGRSVGPVAWSQVWKDALSYVPPHQIDNGTISKVRLAFYRACAPLIVPIYSAIVRTRSIR